MIKYLWSAAGYGLIAVPLLFTRTKRSLGIQTDSEVGKRRARDDAVAGRTEGLYCMHNASMFDLFLWSDTSFCSVYLEPQAIALDG